MDKKLKESIIGANYDIPNTYVSREDNDIVRWMKIVEDNNRSLEDVCWERIERALEDSGYTDEDIYSLQGSYTRREFPEIFYGENYSHSDDFGVEYGFHDTDVLKVANQLLNKTSNEDDMKFELDFMHNPHKYDDNKHLRTEQVNERDEMFKSDLNKYMYRLMNTRAFTSAEDIRDAVELLVDRLGFNKVKSYVQQAYDKDVIDDNKANVLFKALKDYYRFRNLDDVVPDGTDYSVNPTKADSKFKLESWTGEEEVFKSDLNKYMYRLMNTRDFTNEEDIRDAVELLVDRLGFNKVKSYVQRAYDNDTIDDNKANVLFKALKDYYRFRNLDDVVPDGTDYSVNPTKADSKFKLESINESVEGDLGNGYGKARTVHADDYFPNGATSNVAKRVGGNAKQGDNPLQKTVRVSSNDKITEDIHKDLVYKYRNYLKE